MRLENEFVVPRPVDQTWAVLTDLERIAPCLPGAQLTEVTDDGYHGTVRVKVGPVVAQYSGVARFREQDPANHRAVLEAKGRERNGRGTASAVVTADLVDEGEQTRVRVDTDLTISGPLAQFGRGAIAEVSTKLLGQFVERLRDTVLAGQAVSGQAVSDPAAEVAAASGAAPAEAPAAPARSDVPDAAAPDTGEPDASAGGGASGTPVGPDRAAAGGPEAPGGAVSAAPPGDGSAARPAPAPPADPPAAADLDLLRVAAVPVLKRLVPLLLAVAAAVAVVVVVATRR